MSFQFYRQLNAMDCGPTCLKMIAKQYGKSYTSETLRMQSGFTKSGVSLLGISETAEKIGFRTRGAQITFDKLKLVPLPAILHWSRAHFVVLIAIKKNTVCVADPASGMLTYRRKEFLDSWITNLSNDRQEVGTVLILEPSPAFYESDGEIAKGIDWSRLTKYLRKSNWDITQVFISMLVAMLLQLFLPFLTQSMVDKGINSGDLQYISIVLIAQLALAFGNAVNGFIRSRLQLRISNTVNISILSDFWIKLTNLPISYFNTHQTGDTMQRIGDNKQVQSFITGQALSIVFSLLNLCTYSVILILYSVPLFLVFSSGNLIYFLWVKLFLKVRRKLNYASFEIGSKMNNATLQMIQGMQEIKLNNAEQLKRWAWENLLVKQFQLGYKSLNYSQIQSVGALFINQGKDIIITFMVATMVVKGSMTFGMMLAVQYIIGQLAGPISQMIGLAQNLQDVKISFERLNEIHEIKNEGSSSHILLAQLPVDKSITISSLSFSYPGNTEPVLENFFLTIPEGKVTAIVGVSGSGKTTILKLLLKIFEQYQGEIKIGDRKFTYFNHGFWRSQCGAVLQDGFIFNDTIANNIAVGYERVIEDKLINSCKMANILQFVENLPNGFNTVLGAEGAGISQGQRQRLLIARAIYKDPHYLFFDEATNALDANNEKEIGENLNVFFKGRTVIVVAHRLSTVKNADKIVVLDNGKVVEEGTHSSLTSKKGKYYELVKNQLQLGK